MQPLFPAPNSERAIASKNGSAFCHPDTAGNYSNTEFVSGEKVDSTSFSYTTGGGCIARPLREVLAVAQNGQTWTWGTSDQGSFNPSKIASPVFEFLGYYQAGPPGLRQEWQMAYSEAISVGNLSDPEHVIINYSKTKGTFHIPHWLGTVELVKVTDQVTGFVMRDQLKADGPGPNSDTSEASLLEIFGHFKSLPPNWKYLNP